MDMPGIEEPLLINLKQYERILKRREQRSKQITLQRHYKLKDRVKYLKNKNYSRSIYMNPDTNTLLKEKEVKGEGF